MIVVNVKGVHWIVLDMGPALMVVVSVYQVMNTEIAILKPVNVTVHSMDHVSMALVSAI